MTIPVVNQRIGDGFQLPSPRLSITEVGTTPIPFSRTWYLFFQQVFQRLGGSDQITTSDLAQAPPALDWSAVIMTQGDAQSIRTEIGELRSLVAELTRAVFDLQQVVK